jgi:hypothetical protein
MRMLVLGVPSCVDWFHWTGRRLLDIAERIEPVYPEELPNDQDDAIELRHLVE